ncbi:DUF4280 domain-containing protein [Halocella sp. SP3-1]|uniref:DUF4280 domain-containing protein n=1 Tax=Halocella sp. SP3-1 TaxID=2382161 RepID=UPI000F74E75D|nr:DUF4280 domain-containing protein [Halocella sp. SP3-1]AZO95791.1 DUF4280 domain-containing protein [Halocella sp. SP3-1]
MMGKDYFSFDLKNNIDFLRDDESENRECKIKLGDDFLGKGIKPSKGDSIDYEDCYGNRYDLRDNNDLYISSNNESDNKLHELVIKKFEDGDYGIWLVKNAPYYYQDGMIVNYFTLEEAAVGDINAIEANSYLQEENRLMGDFLWVYQGDDIIFPSELKENEGEQGQGSSEQKSGQAVSAAQGDDSPDEGSNGAKESKADGEIDEVGKGGKLFVCHGAVLKCSKGTAPCVFNVADKAQVYIMGKPVATVDDNKRSNMPSFATCKRHDSPPCTPKPTGKWKSGKDSVVIKGKTVLLETSTIKCAYGGTIKIINPGQQLVKE